MTFAGNWLHDTFNKPLAYSGHERNFQAYVNTLTLAPGESQSLAALHRARPARGRRDLGRRAGCGGGHRHGAGHESADQRPDGGRDLLGREFRHRPLPIPGFDDASCSDRRLARSRSRRCRTRRSGKTSVKYDVVEKTIGQLRADMEAGITTSEEITRAYLDRIEFYDQGQFGFHAYEIVAADAIAQAKDADGAPRAARQARCSASRSPSRTSTTPSTWPTTNGSFTFAGFRPARDAFQVARLREAGAVIIGKAALEEYATSGHYSNDAWGQVWNVFNPSQVARSPRVAARPAPSRQPGRGGDGIADRRLALRSGERAEPRDPARHRRPESGTGIMPLVG